MIERQCSQVFFWSTVKGLSHRVTYLFGKSYVRIEALAHSVTKLDEVTSIYLFLAMFNALHLLLQRTVPVPFKNGYMNVGPCLLQIYVGTRLQPWGTTSYIYFNFLLQSHRSRGDRCSSVSHRDNYETWIVGVGLRFHDRLQRWKCNYTSVFKAFSKGNKCLFMCVRELLKIKYLQDESRLWNQRTR